MASFIINKYSSHPRKVEASHYREINGFFYFFDSQSETGNVVLAYKSEHVTSIWLDEEAQ